MPARCRVTAIAQCNVTALALSLQLCKTGRRPTLGIAGFRVITGFRVVHPALTDFAAYRLGSIYKIMIKDHY